MYLRSTKRKNKDGSVTEYYQLAHNERHPETRKPLAKSSITSVGLTNWTGKNWFAFAAPSPVSAELIL